jgi:purine-binding chemotaxis protein CheW
MIKKALSSESIEKGRDTIRTLIVFRVADNLFGIEVEYITEVIEQAHITRVPLVSEIIRGTINVRGVIVPVIDMCRRLYDCEMSIGKSTRIFISRVRDGAETMMIGGMVDEVVMAVDIADADISDSPEFGSKLRPDFIKGVAKTDDRFIVLLDMDRVFEIDDLSNQSIKDVHVDENLAIKSLEYEDDSAKGMLKKIDEEESVEKKSYILFSIGNETYGVDVKRVQEVVKIGAMERLPNAMPFVKGIMNIRGIPIPLVDMRIRCALPEKEYTPDTSVMVINVADIPVGLIVDDVTNVLEIPISAVQDTFHYSAQIERDFISGIAEVMNKFIVLVDTKKILTDEEFENIKSIETDVDVM